MQGFCPPKIKITQFPGAFCLKLFFPYKIPFIFWQPLHSLLLSLNTFSRKYYFCLEKVDHMTNGCYTGVFKTFNRTVAISYKYDNI